MPTRTGLRTVNALFNYLLEVVAKIELAIRYAEILAAFSKSRLSR